MLLVKDSKMSRLSKITLRVKTVAIAHLNFRIQFLPDKIIKPKPIFPCHLKN